MSFRHARSALSEEFAAIRNPRTRPRCRTHHRLQHPTGARSGRVLAIGVVPLIVVRSSAETDSELVPLAGSFALTAICTAVVAWLTANVPSGVIVMVLYRTSPRAASQLVVRTMVESFYRIEDLTGRIALLAVVAGLLSLAFGLPNRQGEDRANSVLDDLLIAQLACLVVALSVAFVAESIPVLATLSMTSRCCSLGRGHCSSPHWGGHGHGDRPVRDDPDARDPGGTTATTLPFYVTPRQQLIDELLPLVGAVVGRLGPLPLIVGPRLYMAWRQHGLVHMKVFLAMTRAQTSRNATVPACTHRRSAQPTAAGIEPCSTAGRTARGLVHSWSA